MYFEIVIVGVMFSSSVLMLMVGQQEGHPTSQSSATSVPKSLLLTVIIFDLRLHKI